MAAQVEVTRYTFKLEIEWNEEVDKNDAAIVRDAALSFMELRACQEDDVPNGFGVSDKLHSAVSREHNDDDIAIGLKIGKKCAAWGDDRPFKDPESKDHLRLMLKNCMQRAAEGAGSLLYQALKIILCDSGVVREVTLEKIAGVFKLCWELFKQALLDYAVDKAFQILGYILTDLIKFLQESGFFLKLRQQLGNWEGLQHLITPYYRPRINQGLKYLAVASVSVVVGGVVVYLFLNKKN